MNTLEIFLTQFSLSLLVFALLGAYAIGPALDRMDRTRALFWLTVPHAFRHLGLVFLVPGVVSPDMPNGFSFAAGYGDLASGVLAIAALAALHRKSKLMIPLVWALTLVGLADLGFALSHASAIPYFQSAWYIPTFVVPLLLVTHVMTARRLVACTRSPMTVSGNSQPAKQHFIGN